MTDILANHHYKKAMKIVKEREISEKLIHRKMVRKE